jgi:RNA polymerase sigma-70 factor (ECF subfamily)
MDRFETVYRQHFAAVFRLAVSVIGRRDVAEDLVSEAFLELHKHFARINLDELPAWLFVVVRNKARDHWRREKVRERHARWLAEQPPAPVRPTTGPLWLRSDRLTPLQRVCLELHYAWGYTVDEIGGRLGLTSGQVKGHLQRARQQLREADKEMAG